VWSEEGGSAMSFFAELKRRNVLRVAIAYVVASWLIIQVAETILPLYGFSDAAPRLVVTVLAIGLVPTLVIAWAFEITPEGLKLEKNVDRDRSITARTGKKLDRIIMGILALALTYFAVDKFVLLPEREAALEQKMVEEVAAAREAGRAAAVVESYGVKSIAVLPFADLSPGHDQEYFSDGISEELLNLLSKVQGLRVISRSSAFSFRGQDLSVPEIARRLNVGHVLEGSVRKSGDRVRITAQLIDARSDKHMWSETYDRSFDDIFAVQEEIASEVGRELEVHLLGKAPKVRQTSPEVYRLYLQARYLARRVTPSNVELAIELYRQVLEADPHYALAWVGLSDAYSAHRQHVYTSQYPSSSIREALYKALDIDPGLAEAHASLAGHLAFEDIRGPTAGVPHLRRALELDPLNTYVLQVASNFLWWLGRLDSALAIQEYLRDLDPVDPSLWVGLGTLFLETGRSDDAIRAFRTVQRLSPNDARMEYGVGLATLRKGDPKAALEIFEREPDEAFRSIGLALAYYDLGRLGESNLALDRILAREDSEDWAYQIAYVHAYRGDNDLAFEYLNKSLAYEPGSVPRILSEWRFMNLHDDPRWLPFLNRIGMAPDQIAAIDLDVQIPE